MFTCSSANVRVHEKIIQRGGERGGLEMELESVKDGGEKEDAISSIPREGDKVFKEN